MEKLFCIFAFLIFIWGCDNRAANSSNVEEKANLKLLDSITDYKNGVYYFPYVDAEFGNALSAFISKHPQKRVTAISGNGIGFQGRDKGYFVVIDSYYNK